jgi:hypothetical protein
VTANPLFHYRTVSGPGTRPGILAGSQTALKLSLNRPDHDLRRRRRRRRRDSYSTIL